MISLGNYVDSIVVSESCAAGDAGGVIGVPGIFGIAEADCIGCGESDGRVGGLPAGTSVIGGNGGLGGVYSSDGARHRIGCVCCAIHCFVADFLSIVRFG